LGCLACVCRQLGETPAMWKLDVKSAFRIIPVMVEHRWACAVVYKFEQQVRRCLRGASVR
jgi:hypothetical protein